MNADVTFPPCHFPEEFRPALKPVPSRPVRAPVKRISHTFSSSLQKAPPFRIFRHISRVNISRNVRERPTPLPRTRLRPSVSDPGSNTWFYHTHNSLIINLIQPRTA